MPCKLALYTIAVVASAAVAVQTSMSWTSVAEIEPAGNGTPSTEQSDSTQLDQAEAKIPNWADMVLNLTDPTTEHSDSTQLDQAEAKSPNWDQVLNLNDPTKEHSDSTQLDQAEAKSLNWEQVLKLTDPTTEHSDSTQLDQAEAKSPNLEQVLHLTDPTTEHSDSPQLDQAEAENWNRIEQVLKEKETDLKEKEKETEGDFENFEEGAEEELEKQNRSELHKATTFQRCTRTPYEDTAAQMAPQNTCYSEEALVFIHIPKNAGTLIEDVAYRSNVTWGRYMDFSECRYDFNYCGVEWHTPPALFLSPNLYTSAKATFCVTRNPYDRIVSEYKYMVAQPEFRYEWDSLIEQFGCTGEGLNSWLSAVLTNYQQGEETVQLCHLLPQSFFIYQRLGSSERCSFCDHILSHEDLPDSFNHLMQKYSYPMRLSTETINEGACQTSLHSSDINIQNADLIKTIYREDFELFQYSDQLPLANT